MARWQDQGESWQTGAALSSGDPADLIWDECTLTEMRNGSVLMSARIDDPKNTDPHHPDTNATRVGTSRGFARSDDGVPAAWPIGNPNNVADLEFADGRGRDVGGAVDAVGAPA